LYHGHFGGCFTTEQLLSCGVFVAALAAVGGMSIPPMSMSAVMARDETESFVFVMIISNFVMVSLLLGIT